MSLRSIFSNPKRLFVCVAILFAYGLYSGFSLPVSMYPATSKPTVNIYVPYGTMSAKAFRDDYGNLITSRIDKISNSNIKVDKVVTEYNESNAFFKIDFAWNTPFDLAKKEADLVVASVSASLPKEISDNIGVWQRNRNSGFFAASVYSTEMSLKELYFKIDPILRPALDKVADAENAVIWNPEQYVINIRLIPEKLAQYGLYPRHIKSQVRAAFSSYAGSEVKLGSGYQKFEIDAKIKDVSELKNIVIKHKKMTFFLSDIADVEYGRDLNRERSFKTNGLSSLILFAKPKSGANVKKMSEDIMKILNENKDKLPKSIRYKIIVDPAAAINKSINNLIKDVSVAALMAVLVLFLFIGGIKNVGTAIIEIPLSMILSFIFMKYIGMNINLISLGGLALAAGMNVDASVVILENIFKKREIWTKLGKSCETFLERVSLVYEAVSEVALPVILSITTTLIVFIPMAFTSDLTNAILGDLAKAVIFSHAISGAVALILVPTVRVVLLKNYKLNNKAPMDFSINFIQKYHEKILLKLMDFKLSKPLFVLIPFVILGALVITLLPQLPREVIGKPGSDWVYMYISSPTANSGRHMENIMQEVEADAIKLLDDEVDYTWFDRQSKSGGQIMFKIKDRSKMKEIEKKLSEKFINSRDKSFYISNWNPAELPLPRENHFKAEIVGDEKDIFITASRLQNALQETNLYERVNADPGTGNNFSYTFKPFIEKWKRLQFGGVDLRLSDLADISNLTKSSVTLQSIDFEGHHTNIKMNLKDKRYISPLELSAYPLKVNDKVISLSSLGKFETIKRPGTISVEDGVQKVEVTATVKSENKKQWEETLLKAKKSIQSQMEDISFGDAKVAFSYPQEELASSMVQLQKSLGFSLLLIMFILWMQFQSLKQVSIIMMTIPLGIIGVIISLYTFGSFLSLNSALGVILLNGITVNNSILLTEVTNTLRKSGLRGKDLIITACKKRLRPIVITSLTTILGMLPVALGLGDGGKILQPLGIAVTCGLILATTITLFIVPVLLYKKEEQFYFDKKDSDMDLIANQKGEEKVIEEVSL